MKNGRKSAENAARLGQDVLGWLAGDPELFTIFLGSSGLSTDDVRDRSEDPEFLGFALDFLLSREEDLLAFCADAGIKPDLPMRARVELPGGELPNWT